MGIQAHSSGMTGLATTGSRQEGDELTVLCATGQLDKAVALLYRMDQQGRVPSILVYRHLLKTCTRMKALVQAKQVHMHLAKHGLESTAYLGETVVNTLVKCGGLQDAVSLFYRLPYRTVVSWTAIIYGYTNSGQGHEAIKLYDCMQEEGVEPDKYTLVSLVKACGSRSNLRQVKRIHSEAVKYGYDTELFVGTGLVDMYAKCGSMVDAQGVFDRLTQRDAVSWTALITAYAHQGQAEKAMQLYEEMLRDGLSLSHRVLVSVIQACAKVAEEEEITKVGQGMSIKVQALHQGKTIHSEASRWGCETDVFICNTLINMYGKCGSVVDAQIVFDQLTQPDVVSWTALMSAYIQQGEAKRTLELYEEMQAAGEIPNDRTFVYTIQACGVLAENEDSALLDGGRYLKAKSFQQGKAVQVAAWSMGYMTDVYVAITALSMYSKCGSVADAWSLLGEMSEQSVVAWNVILASYVQEGLGQKALELYEHMQQDGMSPDDRTFVSALQACGMSAEISMDEEQATEREKFLQIGKAIHCEAWRKGYRADVFIGSALVSMYSRCRSFLDVQHVFHDLPQRDVVAWNVMLSACAQQGQAETALQLFAQMQGEGVVPTVVTLLSVLQACSDTGNLDMCVKIHNSFVWGEEESSLSFANALIHAYGRCSVMVQAQAVFDSLPHPDLISWNTLIAGYARQGNWETSVSCYEQMQLAGVKPDGVTLLAILSACSNAGLVDEGVLYFESVSRKHDISLEIEHYVTLVDLLGRAGYFSRVLELLSTMPMEPNWSMWLCLLGACRNHGEVVLGRRAFDGAVQFKPKQSSPYVLMTNTYAQAGMWDEAMKVNELRINVGAWKERGQSWIEHKQEVQTFVAGHWNVSSSDPNMFVLLPELSCVSWSDGKCRDE